MIRNCVQSMFFNIRGYFGISVIKISSIECIKVYSNKPRDVSNTNFGSDIQGNLWSNKCFCVILICVRLQNLQRSLCSNT